MLGWRAAMDRRFVEHRRWMIRSWALTPAAVTARLYLPTVQILNLPFLAWVPDLLIAEVRLRTDARGVSGHH